MSNLLCAVPATRTVLVLDVGVAATFRWTVARPTMVPVPWLQSGSAKMVTSVSAPSSTAVALALLQNQLSCITPLNGPLNGPIQYIASGLQAKSRLACGLPVCVTGVVPVGACWSKVAVPGGCSLLAWSAGVP